MFRVNSGNEWEKRKINTVSKPIMEQQLAIFPDEINTLDELFKRSIELQSSEGFIEFLDFNRRFRQYSIFNNTLIYLQKPDVTYYATAAHWWNAFRRTVKEDARPLVILAPMTPVLFVYDLPDTEGEKPLPDILYDPFYVEGEFDERILDKTLDNCTRSLIKVVRKNLAIIHGGTAIKVQVLNKLGTRDDIKMVIEINNSLDEAAAYGTLCHELGHIFLGHLGNDIDEWWPDRKSLLDRACCELEAEATKYLVLGRLGLESNAAEYIANYITGVDQLQKISLNMIVKTASLIERMGSKYIPTKKRKKRQPLII